MSLATDALTLAMAQSDPERGRALALTASAAAQRDGDVEASAVAERALGLCSRAMADIDASITHFRRAIRLAHQAGAPQLVGQARMSLSWTLALAGRPEAALAEADRAGDVLRGFDAACLKMQRALILQQIGRLDEALEGYQQALPVFRRAGDTRREARLLTNRGVLHIRRGAPARGTRDLLRSEALFRQLGDGRNSAGALHDLGFAAARLGDVAGALARFDEAEGQLRVAGIPFIFAFDRCELLLSARLVADARRCAEESVAALADGGMGSRLAEARLQLAEAALLEGDLVTAGEAAHAALRSFVAQRRRPWATLARYTAMRVSFQTGDRTYAARRAAARVAGQLAADGWAVAALDARLMAARIALDAGRPQAARTDLEQGRRARHRGPVDLRARAWHAEALLRLADGNRRGALAALDAGLSVVEQHRATLGATELRIHAGGHGQALGALGLRLALDSGRPDRVLRWAERWRAGALRLRPVRPPDDGTLAAELSELRLVLAEVDRAALDGRDTSRLLARQAAIERRIVQHCRHATPAAGTEVDGQVTPATLREALGDRALVELVECDGTLSAVVVTGDRCRLRSLGPAQPASAETEALRFALRRLAWGARSAASRAAGVAAVRHAAHRLDAILLAPVAKDIGDRDLVIVPTGPLHALPWSVLPSCAGRAVVVAPSASLWRRATDTAEGAGVLLVAGPDLPAAADEIGVLADRYPEATVLAGEDATADRVTSAMEGSAMLHLAAHGRFRSDNPLFSALCLADGPLHVYDLEAIRRPPQHIVLAACDSGLSSVRPGDELMGLAAAFLALGTRTLVACVLPVPDGATRTLMLSFHDEMRRGVAPAAALAGARTAAAASDSAEDLVAAAAFTCFGAG